MCVSTSFAPGTLAAQNSGSACLPPACISPCVRVCKPTGTMTVVALGGHPLLRVRCPLECQLQTGTKHPGLSTWTTASRCMHCVTEPQRLIMEKILSKGLLRLNLLASISTLAPLKCVCNPAWSEAPNQSSSSVLREESRIMCPRSSGRAGPSGYPSRTGTRGMDTICESFSPATLISQDMISTWTSEAGAVHDIPSIHFASQSSPVSLILWSRDFPKLTVGSRGCTMLAKMVRIALDRDSTQLPSMRSCLHA